MSPPEAVTTFSLSSYHDRPGCVVTTQIVSRCADLKGVWSSELGRTFRKLMFSCQTVNNNSCFLFSRALQFAQVDFVSRKNYG